LGCAFNSHNIPTVLYYAEQATVSFGAGANAAIFSIRDVMAGFAIGSV
jgi:hypothetical protein